MWKRIKEFWPYFAAEKKRYVLILLALLVVDVVDLLPPFIIKWYIDNLKDVLSDNKVIYYGTLYALAYVVFMVIMGIFRRIMSQNANKTAQVIANRIRRDYFTHLSSLEPAFYNENRIGDLMSRATADIEAVKRVFSMGFILLFDVIFNLLLLPPLLMSLNVRLALYIFWFLPLVPLFVVRVGEVIHRRFERVQAKMADVSACAQENISGVRVIKAYAQEQHVEGEFEKLSTEYAEENVALARWTSLLFPTLILSIGIAQSIALISGGWRVLIGTMSYGGLLAFQLLLMRVMWPTMFLGWFINMIQQASASMKRIMKIMDTRPGIKDTEKMLDVSSIRGEIEFRNCSFAYNGNEVLKNINLKIADGETLALVGHVGSGKSTLVHILPRLLNPNEGEVFIDGMDVTKIPIRVLRGNIGFIPQEIFLFSTSIMDNIRFGCPEATKEQVIEAARISRLSNDLKELPEGYDTQLGERGINLSGGQKQRVAIARGVILKPKILILDDALSSVDADTEREILEGLRGVMKERTSIIISHRLSSIVDADRIVVLENGEIAEEGTHEALLKMDGIYARMYRVQQLERELE